MSKMESYQRNIFRKVTSGDEKLREYLDDATLVQLHVKPKIIGKVCQELIVSLALVKDGKVFSFKVTSDRDNCLIERKSTGHLLIDPKCLFEPDVPNWEDYLHSLPLGKSGTFLAIIELCDLIKWMMIPSSQVINKENKPRIPPLLSNTKFHYNNKINPSSGDFNLDVVVSLKSWRFDELLLLLQKYPCRIIMRKIEHGMGYNDYNAIFDVEGKSVYVNLTENNASRGGYYLSYIFKENPKIGDFVSPLWESYLGDFYPETTSREYFDLLDF